MNYDFIEHLTNNVSNSADWRRLKAAEYPDDVRNLHAADQLERLAKQLIHLNDGAPEVRAYADLCERDGAGLQITEREQELIRSVGFSREFDTAQEFLSEIVQQH